MVIVETMFGREIGQSEALAEEEEGGDSVRTTATGISSPLCKHILAPPPSSRPDDMGMMMTTTTMMIVVEAMKRALPTKEDIVRILRGEGVIVGARISTRLSEN